MQSPTVTDHHPRSRHTRRQRRPAPSTARTTPVLEWVWRSPESDRRAVRRRTLARAGDMLILAGIALTTVGYLLHRRTSPTRLSPHD
jgi:hypothetical protein